MPSATAVFSYKLHVSILLHHNQALHKKT